MNKNNSNIGQVEECSESNISTQYEYGCNSHVTAKRNEEYYATSKVSVDNHVYRDAPDSVKKAIDKLKRVLTYESNQDNQKVKINYISYYKHETWGKRRQVIDVIITNDKKIDQDEKYSSREIRVSSNNINRILESVPKGYKLWSIDTRHHVGNYEGWDYSKHCDEKIHSDEIEVVISLEKITRGSRR